MGQYTNSFDSLLVAQKAKNWRGGGAAAGECRILSLQVPSRRARGFYAQ